MVTKCQEVKSLHIVTHVTFTSSQSEIEVAPTISTFYRIEKYWGTKRKRMARLDISDIIFTITHTTQPVLAQYMYPYYRPIDSLICHWHVGTTLTNRGWLLMAISQLFYDIITVDIILGFDVLRNFMLLH